MSASPTPEQVAAANLVEVTNWQDLETAEKNGYPGRTYDPVHRNFPPIAKAYVSKNWKTPVGPPPPANASGIAPVAARGANMVLHYLDEFATKKDDTIWTSNYSGHSEGSEEGQFGGDTHVRCPGDSTVRLLTFSDPSYLAAHGLAGKYNDWVGGGFGAWNKPLPVGSEWYTCAKMDLHENVAMLPGFTTGNGQWPPELDNVEVTPTLSDPTPTQMQFTPHYMINGQPVNWPGQVSTSATFPQGIDFTKYHVYGCQWGAKVITCTLDGVVWATFDNPDAASPGGDVRGLNGPTQMVVCIQCQTGDPGTPAANPAIDDAHPIELTVDWSMAYVPG